MELRTQREESSDFVSFYDTETVATVADVVKALSPKYILICRGAPVDDRAWYLLERRRFLDLAHVSAPMAPISSLLSDHEIEPVHTIKPGENFPPGAQVTLVLDGEVVTGVVSQKLILEGPRRSGIYTVEAGMTVFYVAQAEFPEELAVGDTASLIITVLGPSGDATLTSEAWEFSLKEPLVVIVRADGLKVLGPSEHRLSAPTPGAKSMCRYELKAHETGQGRVEVRFFQGREWLGELILRPEVVLYAAESTESLNPMQHLLPSEVRSHPDLVLRVRDATHDGRGTIEFELTTREDLPFDYYNTQFSRVLDSDPKLYHRRLFEIIETMPITDTENDFALRNIGLNLFKMLFPPELQRILVDIRNKIRSVQVLSREPHIPWELVLAPFEMQGVEGQFLCEQYDLTRWLDGRRPRITLTLRELRYVIPSYSDPELILPMAEEERQFLEGLRSSHGIDVTAVHPTVPDVLRVLKERDFDALHFSCHGVFDDHNPDTSSLLLERKKVADSSGKVVGHYERLYAFNAVTMTDKWAKNAPLIFLNACQTGREAFSLVGIGGWAANFVQAGCGAFIGSQWSIDDEAAMLFTRSFYTNLLAGSTMGSAVRRARLELRDSNAGATWLAYVAFSHPLARITENN